MQDRRGYPQGSLRRTAIGLLRIVLFLLLLDLCLFALFDVLPDAALIQTGAFGLDPQALSEARARMGLSGPWYERFLQHWSNLLRGDLGLSVLGGYPIAPVLGNRILHSLPLWAGALVVLLFIPIPLAALYARRGPLPAGLSVGRFTATFLIAPQFIAVAAAYAVWVWMFADTNSADFTRWALAIAGTVALPLGVAFVAAANTFHSISQERFCDTYLAIGMRWHSVRLRLAKNVLLSMRSLLSRLTLGILLGTVFAELLFQINGFGYLFVEALRASDINVMRWWMLIAGSVVLIITEAERKT